MSTFCGKMSEMDFISIDKFIGYNLNSRAFFLSHCHKDHMNGLFDPDFINVLIKNNAFLYMSHVSKLIMEKMLPNLLSRIKELDMPEKNFIDLPDINENFFVTLIPAGHCPGSVMFLFEYNKLLLYTGDIRIRVNELKKCKQLYDLTGCLKRIDNIYLDTTFFKKTYEYFPLRDESIQEFCNATNNWLKKNIKNHVSILAPATYGSEYLFMEIYKHLKQPIHVDQNKYELYKCFPEMDKVVTLDAKKTRIHSYCIGWNPKNIICETNYVLNIKPSAWKWSNCKKGNCITEDTSYNSIGICYSSHSSYTELIDIIKFLKPLQITPCVQPDMPSEIKEMEELIENILHEIHGSDNTSEENEEHFENKIVWEKPNVAQEENSNGSNDVFNLLDSPESKRKKDY